MCLREAVATQAARGVLTSREVLVRRRLLVRYHLVVALSPVTRGLVVEAITAIHTLAAISDLALARLLALLMYTQTEIFTRRIVRIWFYIRAITRRTLAVCLVVIVGLPKLFCRKSEYEFR